MRPRSIESRKRKESFKSKQEESYTNQIFHKASSRQKSRNNKQKKDETQLLFTHKIQGSIMPINQKFIQSFKKQQQKQLVNRFDRQKIQQQFNLSNLKIGHYIKNSRFSNMRKKDEKQPIKIKKINNDSQDIELLINKKYIDNQTKPFLQGTQSFEELNSKKIKLQWIHNQNNKILKLHPFFEHYNLKNEDFDLRGNKIFYQKTDNIQMRGGWPYYKPNNCKRYGLNVIKKYDNENDNWLKKNNPGEWAIVFYGIYSPNQINEINNKMMINNIMDRLNKGQMLQPGKSQFSEEEIAVNVQPKQKVGRGIYCSPYLQDCVNKYVKPVSIKGKNKQYRIVLQCKVNPTKIKVCNDQSYWVINESKDIRPYGIILIEQSNLNSMLNPQKQFGEIFTYAKYRGQIQNFIKKYQKNSKKSQKEDQIEDQNEEIAIIEPSLQENKNEIEEFQFLDSENKQKVQKLEIIESETALKVEGMKGQAKFKVQKILELSQKQQKISFQISAVNENNEKIAFVENHEQTFHQFDILAAKEPQTLIRICDQIMNKPLNQKEKQQSNEILKQIENNAKQKGQQSFDALLLAIKQSLQSYNATVSFQKHSSIRTQLSLKSLSTGFLSNQVKCIESLDEIECGWKFNEIKNNKEKLNEFKEWYVNRINKQYNIPKQDIVILNLFKKQRIFFVTWASLTPQKIYKVSRQKSHLQLRFFWQNFSFTLQDFDFRGNYQFQNTIYDVDRVGGWPYYKPIRCKRFGISISKKYERANINPEIDETMEWALVFHGINYIENQKGLIKNFIKKEIFRDQFMQIHKNTNSINKPKQKVGRGIYCSPYLQDCVNKYVKPVSIKGKNKQYRIVLQCKVNPTKIKVCNDQSYWVINESKDIRPYGIILIEQSNLNSMLNPQKQFGEIFTYAKYRGQIQNFIKKYQKNSKKSQKEDQIEDQNEEIAIIEPSLQENKNEIEEFQFLDSENKQKVQKLEIIESETALKVEGMKGQAKFKVQKILELSQKQQKISFQISAVNENNEKIAFVENHEQTFHQFDILAAKEPQTLIRICDQIMNKPLNQKEKQQSNEILKQIENNAKQKGQQSFDALLLAIKQSLQSYNATVSFQKHSSIRTQLSLKSLSTGFLSNQVKCIESLDEIECGWKFNEIKNNKEKLNEFKEWYVNRINKQYNIPKQDIVILNLCKGSINVQFVSPFSDNLNKLNKLKLYPYFVHFHLCAQNFDPRGNFPFKQTKNDIEYRGGWPYYQPVKCKRYGLNVSGKYDNGNDLWLQMNGQPGEWAVAFHGVNYPDSILKNNKKVMNSIMDGLNSGEMLKAGNRQAYNNYHSKNQPTKIIGNGVYCSPHFQISLNQYTQPLEIKGKNSKQVYRLIFQCRVNPKNILVCSKQTYWVINQSKDIRPYGAILVKEQRIKEIPSPGSQFKEQFSYRNFKNQIQQYLKKLL